MATSVVMPALEMAQETGKLVSWKKRDGDAVKKGDIIVEVETDKAVVEIEAQADGTLGGISAQAGDVVPVGQTIAWLLKAGEAVPQSSGQQQSGRNMSGAAAAKAAQPAAPELATPAVTSVAGAKSSPKARRLAREHGVDINGVKGSGANGEVLADDVLRAAKSGANVGAGFSRPEARPAPAGPPKGGPHAVLPPAPSGPADAISTIGRIMAERTTQSWTTVPHFFVARDVDASALNASRAMLIPFIEKSHGVKVTHTDLLVSAIGRTLTKYPRINGSWVDGRIILNQEVNVALAIAVDNAVVTAVIKHADTLSLGEIARARKELSDKARANKLSPADISGATFTISNLGMLNVDAFTAIIVPPQACILAVGAITDRVVVVDGLIGIRPVMTMTLSSDHRLVDGARAAMFMDDVVKALQAPVGA
jgi:pyruvate dehydrogenase E2 component (dihydrolipoamide acetyltransferase)